MSSTRSLPQLAAALCLRTAGFALAWWIITEGATDAWSFGLAASLLAALASVVLLPPPWPRLRMLALLRFLPYFLAQSLAGGVDVVRRAFSARVPTAPTLIAYPVAHMQAAERMAFTLIANLMPGTLATRLQDDCLVLHAIDRHLPNQASLGRLDARIGAVFGRTPGDHP